MTPSTRTRRAPRQLSPKVHALFKRVIKQITQHPETYDQDAGCGSEQCLIGWAMQLHYRTTSHGYISRADLAERIGATNAALERLYWTLCWPDRFQMQLNGVKTPRGRAGVASRRVLHWLKTDGAE